MRIELVALDIAGTTVQEHGAVYDALLAAVNASGAGATPADITRWMGADKRAAVRGLLTAGRETATGGGAVDGQTVEKVYADFRSRLDAAYLATPPTPLPGVADALAVLRAAGIRVALTTGFDRSVTDPLLASIGWDDRVLDAVVCAEEVGAGRPAPYMIFRAMELTGVTDVARVLAAGDTVLDLRAGTNAGAGAVVGVLTGRLDHTVLGRVRHTHLLDSVALLPDLLGLG